MIEQCNRREKLVAEVEGLEKQILQQFFFEQICYVLVYKKFAIPKPMIFIS